MSQFTGGTIGSYSRLWLIITGGFMALVGIVLIVIGIIVGRRAAATDALLATGTPGTATITGLTQTGMYVNENPQIRMQLLVSLPGQTPYATQHTEIVPLMLLGRLNSGAPLNVRVDPMNLNRVAVDWSSSGFSGSTSMIDGVAMPMGGVGAVPVSGASSAAATGATGAPAMDESLAQVQAAMAASGMTAAAPFQTAAQGNYTVEQLRAYLRASGQDASAAIDKLDDSGKVVGDEHLFTMEMTLKIPGQPDRKLPSSAAMVPAAKAHRLFQGMTVPVKYEATNPNLLMVDWEKV